MIGRQEIIDSNIRVSSNGSMKINTKRITAFNHVKFKPN